MMSIVVFLNEQSIKLLGEHFSDAEFYVPSAEIIGAGAARAHQKS
jgi:hypothetical protein